MAFRHDRLAKLREKRELGQKEVAAAIGVKPGTISDYETGEVTPGDEVKILLAQFYNVSLDFLMDLTEDEIPCNDKRRIILQNDFDDADLPKVREYIDLLIAKRKYDLYTKITENKK